MKISTIVILVLLVAVALCAAQSQPNSNPARFRRSPQGHGSVKLQYDSQKGPVAKTEVGGTIWKNDRGNMRLKTGVDYTLPLRHGKGQGGGFIRLEGKFRK